MSDIFLSYKSEDRPKAKIIAEALERHGYSVWWDRIIPPGKTYAQVIEEALDASKCVIVLWSKESVKSDWVKNEAEEGAQRRILIPVLIDDVKIPFEFRHIQAAQLIDWQGALPNPEFDLLLKSVAEIVGRPPAQKMEVKKTSMDELSTSARQLYEEGKYPEIIEQHKERERKVKEDRLKKQQEEPLEVSKRKIISLEEVEKRKPIETEKIEIKLKKIALVIPQTLRYVLEGKVSTWLKLYAIIWILWASFWILAILFISYDAANFFFVVGLIIVPFIPLYLLVKPK